jgi:hypothetical protein
MSFRKVQMDKDLTSIAGAVMPAEPTFARIAMVSARIDIRPSTGSRHPAPGSIQPGAQGRPQG